MTVATITAPAFTRLDVLSPDETDVLSRLTAGIRKVKPHNDRKNDAYEAKRRAASLGVAVPPQFRDVETVLGWPGLTVDVLDERLDVENIVALTGADEGLAEIMQANQLLIESGLANLDALIYGVCFLAVGSGRDGEPDPLVTVEPPTHMTAIWDARSRRLSAAARLGADGTDETATLFLPDQTIYLGRSNGGFWNVSYRDQHQLGRVPVARLVNRLRASDPRGRSEITRAVLAYTDAGVRTLLGMDIAREFYSAPQRYILGADESAFQDAHGNPRSAWETYIGRVLALTRDENGELPQVGQFSASSPAPYLDQLRGLAQLLSAEAAVPASYLGFVTDNPASADAIRQSEARLVKRAERRQKTFGAGYLEMMRLAVMIRDRVTTAPPMQVLWADAGTPTRAAQADAVVKLIGAGVLPPTGDVTWELLGLSDTTRTRLAVDVRRATTGAALNQVAAAAAAARQDVQVAALADRGLRTA